MTTPAAGPEPTDTEVGRKAVELGLITEMQLKDLLARMAAAQEAGDPPAKNVASALVKFGLLTQKQLDGLRGDTTAIRKKFGKYAIVRTLGRGGMGVVYEAIDSDLGRTVALKMLVNNPNVPAEQAALEEERFIREARLSASLPKHPGIVGVYESGVLDGRRYIAMEFVEGHHFEEWRAKSTGSVRSQVAILRDVALAVDHAHRHGVIHRDLKPANVLIGSDGRPRVTDFGLARQIRQDNSLTLTGGGYVMGTPTYISPEQAQGRKDVDKRTDVWGLGVMLYEVLAGRPPFRGETPIDVMMKIVKNPVPYPSAAMTRVGSHQRFDKGIENICMKALAKEPKDRYSSAKAFSDDLARWLKGETVEVQTAKRVKPSPAPIVIAGAAAVAILIAAVAYFSSPSVDKAAAENRERAASLVGQGERHLNQNRNLDALLAFSKALELDPHNKSAAAGKQEAERRITFATQTPRPAPPPPAPAPAPPPPKPAGPTPQELVKKAFEFVQANPKDFEGQVRVWQEARTAATGTPHAAEATREFEAAIGRRRQAMMNDLADVDTVTNALREAESFGPARDALGQAARRRDDSDWVSAIESRQSALKKALDVAYAHAREQAVDAQKKGDAAAVRAIRERIERKWKLPELLTDLDDAVAAVVPAPKPAPPPPPPPPPEPGRVTAVPELPSIEAHRGGIVSVGFSPDGKLLLTASFDQTVRLWDLAARTERAKLSEEGQPRSVAYSADGKWMAAGYNDGKIRLWESYRSPDRTLAGHALQAISLGFSPDSKLLASASTDGTVRLWDPVSGAQKLQLEGHPKGAMSVCWSADGKLLAVACADRMVKLWEMPAGREKRTFSEGLENTPVSVALSRKYVVAAGHDPRICVWDIDTGKVRTLNGHAKEIRGIACSPDGTWIASASADGTLRVWDAASGEMRASFQDEAAWFGVSISRKGDVLVGCTGSGLLRMWDLTSLRPAKLK